MTKGTTTKGPSACTALALSESVMLAESNGLKMPDLSLFDDMEDLRNRLERLFREYIANPEFRAAAKEHAGTALILDTVMHIAKPVVYENGEISFHMTMDDWRMSGFTTYCGGKLQDMIEYARSYVKDTVEIFDGTNVGGVRRPSLEQILDTRDYSNTQMMQIIRSLRVVPVYKAILDTLISIQEENQRLMLQMMNDPDGEAGERYQTARVEYENQPPIIDRLQQGLSKKKLSTLSLGNEAS